VLLGGLWVVEGDGGGLRPGAVGDHSGGVVDDAELLAVGPELLSLGWDALDNAFADLLSFWAFDLSDGRWVRTSPSRLRRQLGLRA